MCGYFECTNELIGPNFKSMLLSGHKARPHFVILIPQKKKGTIATHLQSLYKRSQVRATNILDESMLSSNLRRLESET